MLHFEQFDNTGAGQGEFTVHATNPMQEEALSSVAMDDSGNFVEGTIHYRRNERITQDFADKVGADGFAPDASSATRQAKVLVGAA